MIRFSVPLLIGAALLGAAAGCAHNDAPTTAAAPTSPQQEQTQAQQQFQQTLSSPNLPPALKRVIQEDMKQHGAPQRPAAAAPH